MVLGNLGNLRAAVTAERHIADVDVPKELPVRVSKFYQKYLLIEIIYDFKNSKIRFYHELNNFFHLL